MTQASRKKIFDEPADFVRTADEMRVQLRLAAAEAEERMESVGERLRELKSNIDHATEENLDEMSAAALAVVDDLRGRLDRVSEKLRSRHGGR